MVRMCPECGGMMGHQRRGWKTENDSARKVCGDRCARARKTKKQKAAREAKRSAVGSNAADVLPHRFALQDARIKAFTGK
jgi:hypothetical protein